MPYLPSNNMKQRLLYLPARTPNIFSEILGFYLIEPTKNYIAEITAEIPEWPYRVVHDALIDGWQIIHFPHLQAPIDDDELDVVGYEFILQKMEAFEDE